MTVRRRRFYTTGQAAERVGLTDRVLRQHAADGRIEGAVRSPGGHWRIPVEWVEEQLSKRTSFRQLP